MSAHDVSCNLNSAYPFDLIDDLLEVTDATGKPRGETISEQAEGLLSFGAVPARNASETTLKT